MPIKLGMVMDSIDHINIKKDTSFAMLLEAQVRGWELHYMELNDLFLRNGRAYARTRTTNCSARRNNGISLFPSRIFRWISWMSS